MSYVTEICSPYKCDNLGEECMNILAEDNEYVCKNSESMGIFFPLAYISVMALSVLKVINFIFEQSQKPKMTYSHLEIKRGMEADTITSTLRIRESIGVPETQNHDNFCPNDNIKNQRADKIIKLRNYLYQHDFTLHATVIKKINHRRTEEELLEMYRTGVLSKPLSTTHITFGEELNVLLKEILGDTIDLRTDRFSKDTFIKVLNDDFLPLKDALYNMYNKQVKIKFDEI